MTDTTDGLDASRATPGHRLMPRLPDADGVRHAGALLLVAAPVLLAAWLGLTSYAPHGAQAAFGIAAGAGAVVAMAEALILAARLSVLEPLFGGLDRAYRVHKWLGVSALALMVLHNVIEPDFERSVRETMMGELAEEAGELAFNALLALIAISWFRRIPFLPFEIPYHLWRFSHRFMGALFAVIVFHQFFVDMPRDVDPALSLLLNGFGVAGVLAWVHTEFVAPRLRARAFTVSRIERHGETTAVTLAPKGRAMRWKPGQFAFLSAPEAGFAEPHPFTIASAPRPDGAVTFAIRALGGWTRGLPGALREGMGVRLEGPYGRFDFRRGGARQVWLAGGVGVTPFLAWAESLTAREMRDIRLIYAVRTPDEAIGLETLRAAAQRNPRFSFEVVASARDGRLTAERLLALAPFALDAADLWFCGPAGLKDTILDGLRRLGQTPRRVRFEHFALA